MSKHEKLLEKLCGKPAPSDFTWDELKSVLLRFGYKMEKGSGSRRKFYNVTTKALIICHEPHPHSTIGKATVTDIVEHIRARGLI
ncbi:putative RNA binding protein YcfA (HicA-like mRNA interferase family) [Rhodanobacter sp. MP1X3]|nr:putative RNA binding protein YcfA (HicA-like mRNA interferase family) [Rhodanobacter sp. MP1X3]